MTHLEEAARDWFEHRQIIAGLIRELRPDFDQDTADTWAAAAIARLAQANWLIERYDEK